MKSEKKKYLMIIVIISFFVIIGSLFWKKSLNYMNGSNTIVSKSHTIMIRNNTNKIINDLEIISISGEQLETLTNFLTKEQRGYTIDNEVLASGDSIILKGKNNLGEQYEQLIIGDINKKHNGSIVIDINDVTDNGEVITAVEVRVY